MTRAEAIDGLKAVMRASTASRKKDVADMYRDAIKNGNPLPGPVPPTVRLMVLRMLYGMFQNHIEEA